MLLLSITATWLSLQAPAAIFKCVNANGQVSYAQQPCPVGDKAREFKDLPGAPSAAESPAPGAPTPAPASPAAAPSFPLRQLPPPLLGDCRNEVIELRRSFDTELDALEREVAGYNARMKEIIADEEIAGDSKVAEAWLQRLAEDRVTVQRELTELSKRRRGIYQNEKERYEELKTRCELGANPGV